MSDIISSSAIGGEFSDALFTDFFNGVSHLTHYDGFNEFFLDDFANSLNSHYYFEQNQNYGTLSNLPTSGNHDDYISVVENGTEITSIEFSTNEDSYATTNDETQRKDRSEIASHRYMQDGETYAYSFNFSLDFQGGTSQVAPDSEWLNVMQIQSDGDGTLVRLAVYTDANGDAYMKVVFNDEADDTIIPFDVTKEYNVSFAMTPDATNPEDTDFTIRITELHSNPANNVVYDISYDSDNEQFTDMSDPYLRLGVYRSGYDDDGRDAVGNDVTQTATTTFTDIEVYSSAENANFSNVLTGTAGNDTLGRSDNSDFREDDQVLGMGGDDYLYGGYGEDDLDGGTGADSIDAGAGDDVASGGDGDDVIWGQGGADDLSGGAGADSIRGGDQNDTISGGTQNDSLFGDNGDDQLNGNDGADSIRGGEGNDTLYGENENDSLYGGNGDDTLNGGLGDDSLLGGAGADVFVFSKYYGDDTITGFDLSEDSLDLDFFINQRSLDRSDITTAINGTTVIATFDSTHNGVTTTDTLTFSGFVDINGLDAHLDDLFVEYDPFATGLLCGQQS